MSVLANPNLLPYALRFYCLTMTKVVDILIYLNQSYAINDH